MKIAVLSDTHIPKAAKELPDEVIRIVEGADLVIHAGDYVDESVIERLKSIAEFKGVQGNMDPYSICKLLPKKLLLEIKGVRIGVIHGDGSPIGLEKRVMAAFKNEKIDMLIYGHSHTPKNEKIGDVIVFNPGSPTDRFFAPYQSMGIITIEEEIKPEIIRL